MTTVDAWAGEARRVLRERAGIDVVTMTPTRSGESGAAFWITDRTGAVMLLKIISRPGAAGHLRRVDAVTGRLRDRGYPAPRCRFIGQAAGVTFWVQERLPGTPLEGDHGRPGRAAVSRLLGEVIRLNDAQAGLGDGRPGWPELITTTLTSGGDGYCVHSTLRDRPDTRDLLAAVRRIGERSGPAIAEGSDFVHFDFSFANLLSDGTAITGVIDVNPPVLAGDRAFDLATLLFYDYDHDDLRTRLRTRLLDLAGLRPSQAYLAHMVLRQVDWSLRHHPGAAVTRRHLALARLVMSDVTGGRLS
jgi:aminoglycoside phosphotransferase